MTPELDLFGRFGLALFIGLLIGLEREYAAREKDQPQMAGVRTYALMGILGAVAALVGEQLNNAWGFIAISVIFGGLIVAGYSVEAEHGGRGLTSEVAALLTYLSGALCYWEQRPLAVALGVTTMALLSLKPVMHTFAHRLTREDVYATLKFAVITAIILPVLPDMAVGPAPFDVLNPHQLWRMVVLISGISFSGYALMKLMHKENVISLSGVLGGLVSSTAVTLSFAQRSRTTPGLTRAFATGIVLAWTVMFARVLVIVFVVYSPLARLLAVPMLVGVVSGAVYSVYLIWGQHRAQTEEVVLDNPFELGPAFKFGLLYAMILVVARAAQLYSGTTGVYISSALAGLTDVSAITLSLSELAQHGVLDMTTATRSITMAALVNTLSKGGLAWVLGTRDLRKALIPGLVLVLVTTLIAAFGLLS